MWISDFKEILDECFILIKEVQYMSINLKKIRFLLPEFKVFVP